jgi:hypothetical protein
MTTEVNNSNESKMDCFRAEIVSHDYLNMKNIIIIIIIIIIITTTTPTPTIIIIIT